MSTSTVSTFINLNNAPVASLDKLDADDRADQALKVHRLVDEGVWDALGATPFDVKDLNDAIYDGHVAINAVAVKELVLRSVDIKDGKSVKDTVAERDQLFKDKAALQAQVNQLNTDKTAVDDNLTVANGEITNLKQQLADLKKAYDDFRAANTKKSGCIYGHVVDPNLKLDPPPPVVKDGVKFPNLTSDDEKAQFLLDNWSNKVTGLTVDSVKLKLSNVDAGAWNRSVNSYFNDLSKFVQK
jgi:hypothetical protein